MKPAGPERDKVIAEMRGGDHHDEWFTWCIECDTTMGGIHKHCQVCGCETVTSYPKPYSTDIAYAMELELPVNHYEIVRRGKKIQALCWVTLNPEGIYHESEWHKSEAAALADARSGAWLKWREGELI